MAKRPPEPEPAEAGLSCFLSDLSSLSSSSLWLSLSTLTLKGLSRILELLSFLVVVVTFPVSLFFTLKTTKEYERVVIFRLGRSLGRAR